MNLIQSARRDYETTGAAGFAILLLFVGVVLNRYRVTIVPLAPQLEHFAILFALGILAWLVVRHRAQIKFQPSDLLLVAYLCVALGSALLFPQQPRDSVPYWFRRALAVAVYFVVRWLIPRGAVAAAFRLGVKALLIFGALEAGFGIFSWFLYPFGVNLGVDQYPLGVRGPGGIVCNFSLTMYGTLWEPNVFGSALMAIILIGAALFVSKEFTAWRKPLGIGLLIMLIALGLNSSRGSIGTLALGLLLVLFFAPGMLLVEKVKWAVVAALVVLLINIPSLEVSRVLIQLPSAPGLADRAPCAAWFAAGSPNLTQPGDTALDAATGPEGGATAIRRLFEGQTLESRWVSYKQAWDDSLKRPLFGNGPNSFGEKYTTTAHTPGWISNMLLMALHDTGIVGLFLLCAWFAWYGWRIFSAWRRGSAGALRTLALALGIGLLALFVAYQATTMLWFGFVWWYCAILEAGALLLKQGPVPAPHTT